MAKIIVKFKNVVRQEIELVNPITTIGRNPTNDIHIDNLAVSRFHSQIVMDGDAFSVEDLNSNNGTFVNGKKVMNQELKEGDSIIVGKHTLVFSLAEVDPNFIGGDNTTAAGSSEPSDLDGTFMLDAKVQQSLMQQQKEVAAMVAAQGGKGAPPPQAKKEPASQLKVLQGDLGRSAFDLVKASTTIGKSPNCDIQVGGFFTPGLAAVVSRSGQEYTVNTAGGWLNKPKVNGQTLAGPHRLREGDLIEVSGIKLQFTMRR